MDNSPPPSPFQDSQVLQVSAKIMLLCVIVLFIVVTFVLLFHIYARWHWSSSNTEDPSMVAWRRRRFAFLTTGNDRHDSSSRTNRRGLDTKSLESLPIILFNPKDYDKEGLECSVCLSEVEQGEKMRVLPNCNHGFHVDCIDMWFQSHSTCPLCRNPVLVKGAGNEIGGGNYLRSDDEDGSSSLRRGFRGESSGFPTNVLFLGNESQQVRSLGGGQEQQVVDATSSSTLPSLGGVGNGGGEGRRGRESLVIDIPKRVLPTEINCSPMGVISSSSTHTHHDGEEMKSPSTPMSTRLKRLLSRGKKVAVVPSAYGSSSSSSEYATDVHHHQIEQV